MKQGIRCEVCGRVPEYVKVDCFHALNILQLTVRCHGETATMDITPPPINGMKGFTIGKVHVI